MPQFINLTTAEQNDLILRTASKLSISPLLIEKDFWVSWLLNKIFQSNFAAELTFKGGTSLSKCYGYISRFSEDIDLTLDRRHFSGEIEEKELSKKGLEKLIDSNDQKASAYVRDSFVPFLKKMIAEELGRSGWQITPDEMEPKNIRFHYPSILKTIENPYIKQSVLLELGVRGDIEPSTKRTVMSYIEDAFNDILDYHAVPVQTLSPVRTFWEKITLLHAENNRPAEKSFGDRLSRHYYDVYQLITHGVSTVALQDLSLLHAVIDHKKRYFRSGWAKYEDAVPGTLRITPLEHLKEKLVVDYKAMEQMIFGPVPSFHAILGAIKDFELAVN